MKSRSSIVTALVAAAGIVGWYMWRMIHSTRRDVTEVCLSNVRQCGLALRMYAQDYDGRLPMLAGWMDASWPYVKNDTIFACPEVRRNGASGYGYAFRSDLLGQRLDRIRHPAEEPIVFDSALLARNACTGLESLPRPPRHSDHMYNVIVYADGGAYGVSQVGKREPLSFFKGSPGWP